MSHSNDVPAAAWYPDPQTPGQVRWWDGTKWTEHVSTPSVGQAAEQKVDHHVNVAAAEVDEVATVATVDEIVEHTATVTYIGRHAAGATPAQRQPSTAPRIRPRQRAEMMVEVPATSPSEANSSVAEKLLSYA